MIGTVLNNTYKLEEELAEGTCFTVYRAVNVETGHAVAVKTVKQEIIDRHPDFPQMFLSTAQDCARLSHPGINTIIEAAQHDGTLFAATNFIEGRTLGQELARRGTLSAEEAAAIVADTAAALHFIHTRGYIHRNIKPGNIFLWKGSFTPVLTDFGLLKPEYIYPEEAGPESMLAPEQISGRNYSAASDIFVLGALAYLMLAGSKPFSGDTPEQKFSALPMRLRAVVPDVPATMEKAVMRAMAQDPAYRFASAADFARDFCVAVLPHIEEKLDAARAAAPREQPGPAPDKTAPHDTNKPLIPARKQPRDTANTGNHCAYHPDREAAAFCIRCGKALCPECEQLASGRPHCSECLPPGHSTGVADSVKKINPSEQAGQAVARARRAIKAHPACELFHQFAFYGIHILYWSALPLGPHPGQTAHGTRSAAHGRTAAHITGRVLALDRIPHHPDLGLCGLLDDVEPVQPHHHRAEHRRRRVPGARHGPAAARRNRAAGPHPVLGRPHYIRRQAQTRFPRYPCRLHCLLSERNGKENLR